MKVLIIGLGHLGNYVLENISKNKEIDIEIYTRDNNKKFNNTNIVFLDKLENASQPDLIFITANLYKPEDRFNYLEKCIKEDNCLDFRDHESSKNKDMILEITEGLKNVKQTPTIITANPPELLVKLVCQKLNWNSVYNMQMMLDNIRISKITGLPEDEYLCIGEHGRPTPILSHIKSTNDTEYEKIDYELSKIVGSLCERKGVPALNESKEALDKIIDSITNNKELKCILTSYKNGIAFGRPFIIKGLEIIEQQIPELSLKEKELFNETKIRLIKKWGNSDEKVN